VALSFGPVLDKIIESDYRRPRTIDELRIISIELFFV
jgi:hypothetical protein